MKELRRFKPDCQRLSDHLRRLSKERNFETTPQALAEVESYLQNELRSQGFHLRKFPFAFAGENFSNLIASFEENPRRPRLIVGAHFDSVPGSPGADDNASGVSALLEAARIYSEAVKEGKISPERSPVSVEFAAFNIEEYGMIGSRAYAQKLKKERVPVFGMLSLEMIGCASQEKGSQKMPFFLKPFYPKVGNFIGLVANTKSKSFLQKVETIFRGTEGLPVESLTLPANGWIFPEARLSDHSPFWDAGFPALLVTDTSFFRNPHYHTESDRIETLNLDFLARVTEAAAGTVLELAREKNARNS